MIPQKSPEKRAPWWARALAVLAATALAAYGAAPPSSVGALSEKELSQGYRDGRVLAKPNGAYLAKVDALEKSEGMTLRAQFERFGHVRVIGLSGTESVKDAVARLRATGRYDYVEPDYLRHTAKVPNDAQFPNQWALSNDGSGGGIAGADIHAEGAWDVITSTTAATSTSPGVIIGIVDSGAYLTHEDLMANLWVNPSPGTPATFSTEDSTGGSSATVSITDSLNGINAVAKTGTPQDDLGHGTHVSGIAGAVGNNGLGVSGVAWKTQLMELKFISSSDSGSTADELPCIEYAISHKVSVLNASYGDQAFSRAEMDAIYAAGKAGIIFVCAAGNSTANIDISPFYPADYPLDNIICVGATDNRDNPAIFSNFGSGSVELFAPGDSIISTYNTGTSSYVYESGTSMAAPFVTGAVALVKSQFPGETYRQTINRILNSVDAIPVLAGKAQTGGRLNLTKAVTTAANTPPNDTFATRTVLVGADPYTRSNNADSPATPESGTPVIVAGAGHSLWWQWTAPEDADVEIDTSGTGGGSYPGGSSYPTELGVYTGTSLGSLSVVKTNSDYGTEPVESGGGSTMQFSAVSFHTTAGTTYQINVEGLAGASGQTILSINTTPDNDTFALAKAQSGPSFSVAGTNMTASREPGEALILGHSGGHSLWYSWTAPSTGTFQVSGYSYDFSPDVAVYTGSSVTSLSLVSSAAGGALAGLSTDVSNCLCTFTANAGTTYYIALDGATSGDTGEFTLTLDDSLWQAVTGDSVTCSASVAPDGTVYVGSDDNSLYAYGPDGSLKWSHAAQGVYDTSSAAVGADGTVYAGNTDGNVYAYTEGGSLKWQYPIQGAVGSGTTGNTITCSTSLGSDGTIYTHGSDGNVYAINPNGSLKWMAAVPGASYAAPTLAPDGTVYISTDAGSLYAINPGGTQKWIFTAPVSGEPIYTAASIDSAGNLYIGTLSGNFYSVTPAGKLRWTYAVGDGITSAPALANGSVYFGGYDGYLYALSASAGTLEWKCPIGSQVRASGPAVDANGTIYIGSYDHNIYAVSPSGSVVRKFPTSDYIRSSPAIAGTRMYVGSEDHKLYAFDLGVGAATSDWPMYQFDLHRVGHVETLTLGISTQPVSQTAYVGGALTLSVGATGPGALTYQWSFNGNPIAGATGPTYTVVTVSAATAGSYSVTVTSGGSSVTSSAATVTVSTAPPGRIVNLSARASVGTGSNILIAGFVIQGSGSKNVLLRGVGPTLAGAPYNVGGTLAQPVITLFNQSNVSIESNSGWGNAASIAAADTQVGAFALASGSADAAILTNLPAGGYTSQISGAGSTSGVALAEIYDADTGVPGTNLINISARANIGTGSNILIAGFVVQGSQPVKVLLRGVGPTLAGAPYNVGGTIAQPEIDLYNQANVVIQSNKGWANSAAVAAADTQAGAFALAANSVDAAMVATLPPGNYTLQMVGQNGSTGVGLVEVYLLQ